AEWIPKRIEKKNYLKLKVFILNPGLFLMNGFSLSFPKRFTALPTGIKPPKSFIQTISTIN
ncbi:MAG TPA: hypothetical protein VK856_06550, partial [Anaerolineaceae bacterium]|nr:hypothetical protein [Anaerolineaceae bacterium]